MSQALISLASVSTVIDSAKSLCGVVILSFNARKPLSRLIQSIAMQDYPNIVTIVVDNASSDGTQGMLEAHNWVRVIREQKNLGAASANKGMHLAVSLGCKYLFLVDSDVLLERDTVSRLIEFMGSHTEIGIVGPAILGLYPHAGAPVVRVNRSTCEVEPTRFVNEPSETECIGAAMVTREVVSRTDGYDPSYFMYYTDVDFCLKARRTGFKIYILPHVIIHHEAAYSISKVPGLRGFLTTRNRCMLAKKNFSSMEQTIFLKSLPFLAFKNIGLWLFRREIEEAFLCFVGTCSGLVFLITGKEPRTLKRIATGLMKHRISLGEEPTA